jgi:hypothetical protein
MTENVNKNKAIAFSQKIDDFWDDCLYYNSNNSGYKPHKSSDYITCNFLINQLHTIILIALVKK